MQRQKLRSVVVKKYNHKANQGKVPDDKENVFDRNFKAKTIKSGLPISLIFTFSGRDGHI